MLVWDNQQATAWFTGILEGEGTFKYKDTGYKAVDIANNDLDIIEQCEKFLQYNHVLFNRYVVKAGKKTGYRLIISMQDCINLYMILDQQMQCRRNEYQRIVGASETECGLTVDYHWLTGIFEAEGAFFLSENHRNSFTARIELDNTNDLIINRIVKCLHSLGSSWYIKQYEPSLRKPYKKITMQGVKRCSRFLRVVNTWRSTRIVNKARILLEYCQERLSKPEKSKYGDVEHRLVSRLRYLNSQ